MKRIRKGDEVVVIAGKSQNKGYQGTVKAVIGDRVIVEGINWVSRHVKANPQLGIEGGIVREEAPIHVSNVMLFNPALGKGDRVGFEIKDGKKYRIFKSNGARVD